LLSVATISDACSAATSPFPVTLPTNPLSKTCLRRISLTAFSRT